MSLLPDSGWAGSRDRPGIAPPAEPPAVEDARSAAASAEQVLLGAMMYPETARPKLAPRLAPEEWQEPLHATIATAVWKLRERGITTDPTMVAAMLDRDGQLALVGGLHYLAGLIRAAPTVGDETDCARMVRDLAAKRALHAVSLELGELALQPGLTAPEAVERVGPTLARLSAGEAPTGLTLRQLARREAAALRRALPCYSTGLAALDDVMLGGLYGGKLYAFAARMKKGKSLLLGNIAYNVAAQGVPVLLIALEMGDDEFTHRLAAAQLGTNQRRFLRRPADDLAEKMETWADGDEPALDNLIIEDRPGCTLETLRRVVADYRARHGIKVVVADYWQKVTGRREREETDVAHLGNVASWMAQDAKANGCPWVTAAQINREGDTRGGDGLKVECSMYLRLHQVVAPAGPTQLWMEMEDTRYTPLQHVGSKEQPLLYIDGVGPRVAQWNNR